MAKRESEPPNGATSEFGDSALTVVFEGGAEILLPIGDYSFIERQDSVECKPHPVSIGERRNRVELPCVR